MSMSNPTEVGKATPKATTIRTPLLYVITPSETPYLRQIQQLADRSLLSTDPLWKCAPLYADIRPDTQGLDSYLRDLLFPSKSCRRGSKAPPVNTGAGRRPRGRPRKGTELTESERQAADLARSKSNQVIQRNSKQRSRCENKLLTLIFSAMYDIGVPESIITAGIPPLRVEKLNKNGKVIKTKSDYQGVRAYLRRNTIFLITIQCEALRALEHIACKQVDPLPSTTLTITRTFLAMYTLLNESGPDTTRTDANSTGTQIENSLQVLEACLESIVSYGADWWRRNYSRGNSVPHAAAMKRDHRLIRSSEDLLKAMIEILHPRNPSDKQFRSDFMHNFGCSERTIHTTSSCHMCRASEERQTAEEGGGKELEVTEKICHRYVDALTACCNLSADTNFQARESVLSSGSHMTSAPLWKHCFALSALHKLQVQSATLRTSVGNGVSSSHRKHLQREFIDTVRMDVGCFWVAMYASNEASLFLLRSFNIKEKEDVKDTVVQVILGGTVSMKTLIENEDAIVDIAGKLFTKEASQDFTEEEQREQPTNGDVAGIQHSDVISPPISKRPRTSVSNEDVPRGREADGEGEQDSQDHHSGRGVTQDSLQQLRYQLPGIECSDDLSPTTDQLATTESNENGGTRGSSKKRTVSESKKRKATSSGNSPIKKRPRPLKNRRGSIKTTVQEAQQAGLTGSNGTRSRTRNQPRSGN